MHFPTKIENSLSAIERQEFILNHALRGSELFRNWPTASISRLKQISRVEVYERHAEVLGHDRFRREILVVAAGCLEASRVNEIGKKFLFGLAGPGSVVALPRLLVDSPMLFDYRAHIRTYLVHISGDELLNILDENPILWGEIAKLMLMRRKEALEITYIQAVGSIQQRVAAMLTQLSKIHGIREKIGKYLKLNISQDDIAAMLGVSRQSANKELRALEIEGIIKSGYQSIIIMNSDDLINISQLPSKFD